MWLLNSETYRLEEFSEPDIPRYAVLSHIWGQEEVSFEHLQGAISLAPSREDEASFHAFRDRFIATGLERGFDKIVRFCYRATSDGIQWVWMDTCCIDRSNSNISKFYSSNSAELSDTLNSMYTWFERAAVCYAYLPDVYSWDVENTLKLSRWFLRKWTLQELVAPRRVTFFSRDWAEIGTRYTLKCTISEVTGIQLAVLDGGKSPKDCYISERMAWAQGRTTTRVEDEAYSLMGLLDVKMPIKYGEGSRAFRRLKDEMKKNAHSSPLETTQTGMRLLATDLIQLKDFRATDSPEYAILSHTWGAPEDEVSFPDMSQDKGRDKHGYQKIKRFCEIANSHGFKYLWVDTCCINKESSAELQEAICSMYRWYKLAQVCYVYLEDNPDEFGNSSFWSNKWFTRGWTLQELIAPTFVYFYDKKWNEIGTKLSLCYEISEVTNIDPDILLGSDLTKRTVAERMSWAASRFTTRVEDTAYSLMGLFNVFMPMLYGEGSRAFIRLQEESMKQSEDYTIFAWEASFLNGNNRGLLAHSPDEFLGSVKSKYEKPDYRLSPAHPGHKPQHPHGLTSKGLEITLPLRQEQAGNRYLAWVCSLNPTGFGKNPQEKTMICIWLQHVHDSQDTFMRILPTKLERRPISTAQMFTGQTLFAIPSGEVSNDGISGIKTMKSGTIVLDLPRAFKVRHLLPIPQANFDDSYQSIDWQDMDIGGNLLYSYNGDNCSLAALVLGVKPHMLVERKGFRKPKTEQDKIVKKFIIFIGFRNSLLPWCSVFTLEEVAYRGDDLNAKTTIHSIHENFKKTNWSRTDRSSRSFSDGSTVTAALRVGCPTYKDTTVFRLHVQYKEP